MPLRQDIFSTRTILNATTRWALCMALVVLTAAFAFPLHAAKPKPAADKSDAKASTEKKSDTKKDPFAWRLLFDGKTLEGWKAGKFGGEGEIEIKDSTIFMWCGESLTGIVSTGKPPRMNYEISLEAKRLDGADFFATTTFPIGKSHCSLVVGGWGGTVVGLSCVDFYDAGDNITTQFVDLKTKQWYTIRIRVSKARIEAWIDKEQVVDLRTEGHKFDTRFEVDLCKPLGIASWCTSAALRNIRIRDLKPQEVTDAAKPRDDE